MDVPLHCNGPTGHNNLCRRDLIHEAVATSCSHIFCGECVKRFGFSNGRTSRICPACKTPLPKSEDAVVVKMRPSEDWQSTALAGLDPQTIVECARKALSFYQYQVSTEITWQTHLAKAAQEKYSTLHTQATGIIEKANQDIDDLRVRFDQLQLEKDQESRRLEDAKQQLQEKTKKLKDKDTMYQLLKSQCARGNMGPAASLAVEDATIHPLHVSGRPEADDVVQPQLQGRYKLPAAETSAKIPAMHHYEHGLHVDQGRRHVPAQSVGERTYVQPRKASSDVVMGPPQCPMHSALQDPIHRINTTMTPAHRASLGRTSAHICMPVQGRVSLPDQGSQIRQVGTAGGCQYISGGHGFTHTVTQHSPQFQRGMRSSGNIYG